MHAAALAEHDGPLRTVLHGVRAVHAPHNGSSAARSSAQLGTGTLRRQAASLTCCIDMQEPPAQKVAECST